MKTDIANTHSHKQDRIPDIPVNTVLVVPQLASHLSVQPAFDKLPVTPHMINDV